MRFKVGEINVICSDLERSIEFYRDVLGFDVIGREGDGCHMRCGGTGFLLLGVAHAVEDRGKYCDTPSFSVDLMVEDIDEAIRHFKSNGVEFEKEKEVGAPYVFIRDPDGLVFEVIQDDMDEV